MRPTPAQSAGSITVQQLPAGGGLVRGNRDPGERFDIPPVVVDRPHRPLHGSPAARYARGTFLDTVFADAQSAGRVPRIAVTDSGWGGVSVMSAVSARLLAGAPVSGAELLFFNALQRAGGGYNDMTDPAQKVRVFSDALFAMDEAFQPDAVLIACNTLSVIVGQTPFVQQRADLPVLDILESGVGLITANLNRVPDSEVVILGTPMTINSGVYPGMLAERGIDPSRVHSLAFDRLHLLLDAGAKEPEIRQYVASKVGPFVASMRDPSVPLVISLNCTHYGYVADVIVGEFARLGVNVLAHVNPNQVMSSMRSAGEPAQVSARVLTQVHLVDEFLNGDLVARMSPPVSAAMKGYEFRAGMF